MDNWYTQPDKIKYEKLDWKKDTFRWISSVQSLSCVWLFVMLFDLKHLHSDSHDTFVYDFISVVLSPYIMLFFIDL